MSPSDRVALADILCLTPACAWMFIAGMRPLWRPEALETYFQEVGAWMWLLLWTPTLLDFLCQGFDATQLLSTVLDTVLWWWLWKDDNDGRWTRRARNLARVVRAGARLAVEPAGA